MTGPEVEPYQGDDRRAKCPDCKHEVRWHCYDGCMLPACDCRKAEEAIKFANKYQVSAQKTFEDSLGTLHNQRFDLYPHAVPPLLRALSFPTYPFLRQGDVEMLMKVLSHLP